MQTNEMSSSDEILLESAKLLERFIQRDDEYPDLGDKLARSDDPSGSNVNIDYKQVPSFLRRDTTPVVLPQTLQDYLGCMFAILFLSPIAVVFFVSFSCSLLFVCYLLLVSWLDVQCNVLSGFFPEIQRAYLTIDSKVFLWDYKQKYACSFLPAFATASLSVFCSPALLLF
jgi:hypothetical protein